MGDDTANVVRAAWTAVLGVEPQDGDDNFFEAGGDSLSAVELVASLASELGVDVPVAEIYRSPTVAGLLAAVDAARSDEVAEVPTAHHTTGRTLVRLRRAGSGRLWCFLPPLSGAVTRYAAMPQLLPPGDAIWAMETPAILSASGMDHLITGLTDRLIQEDLARFSTMVISGYSLGGVFAHELARALASRLDQGGPLLVAALLDPPEPTEFRPSIADAFDIFVRVGWRIPEPATKFVRDDGTFALDDVAAAARAIGTLAPSASDRELSDAWTVYAANARILEGYVPGPGVAATYLLGCDVNATAPAAGWSAGGPAKGAWASVVPADRVSQLPTDHFAMLEAPNDTVVGRWLASVAQIAAKRSDR